MAPDFRSLRLAAGLLASIAISFASLPVTAASASPASASTASASPASALSGTAGPATGHDRVSLEGDSPATSSAARRASYAWTGRRITFYETIAPKWDWSLSTALNKWNHTGGGIRFVRTTSRSRAQVVISSADIGAAAGVATVGRTRHAYVHLSSAYDNADELDAHYRIEVMMIFAHELGHVLGFHHSSTACSLMAPMLDVEGCHTIPAENPGYYRCRTIGGPLARAFVRLYGGRAKFPDSWCPIDKIPPPLTSVDFTSSPVIISWASPASVPSGSRVMIRSWQSDTCDAVPDTASTAYAAVTDGAWQDTAAAAGVTSCFRVELVNRYGAGQDAVAHLMAS